MMRTVLVLAGLAAAAAFAPTVRKPLRLAPSFAKESTSTADAKEKVNDFTSKLSDSINVEDLAERGSTALAALKGNVQEGQVGERGEVWTAGLGALLLFTILGTIPIVGDLAFALAGPGLLLGGLGVVALSGIELGKSITPFPAPVKGNELKTTGPYSLVRHPMYTGIIASCLGLGVISDSADRLLVAALLALFIDQLASREEQMLGDKHVAYKTYKDETAKFIPQLY